MATNYNTSAHYNSSITYAGATSTPPLVKSSSGWLAALNNLAGTTGLGELAAANAYAGTTGLGLLAALNAKAGTNGLGLNAACNTIAGTTGLEALDALCQKAGL